MQFSEDKKYKYKILSMKLKGIKTGCFLLMVFPCQEMAAQDVAVKTNLVYWATTTPNIGVEVALSPKWTIDVSGGYNPWTFSNNKKWKHWLVQPELRYWLCEKMGGHFFGLHLNGGQYNMGNINANFNMLGTDFSLLKDSRYEGWFVGAGFGYGYAWMLNQHFNLEAEIGVGYNYSHYDRYECATCGSKVEKDKNHNYIGPTKAAINLVYTF